MNGLKLFAIEKLVIASGCMISQRQLATSWNPKWRSLRAKKVKKPELPKYDEMFENASATAEERRSYGIKNGVEPPISFEYKPINITSSAELFDPYVPPEGDGKATIITKAGLNQVYDKLKSKGTQMRHIRKIKQYEDEFEPQIFSDLAHAIFVNAHDALQNRNSDKLLEYVTESCYPKMWSTFRHKTIRWQLTETIEPPRLVHVITREMLSKSNMYAQATVRMHTKQILAVYDRFGRLAFGSEHLEKNVIEYVVFEKHLTNVYGTWRLHDKIVPSWSIDEKMPILKTYRQPKMFKLNEDVSKLVAESKFKQDDSHLADVQ